MNNFEWYKSASAIDNKPEEWDLTSSETTVYQRRNITKVIRKDMSGNDVEGWEYEERKIPRDVYMSAHFIADAAENKRELDIISEYTEQLIEEGVIS